MNNKHKVKIGGTEYEVKYTFGSFLAMHEKHGVNVFNMSDPTPRTIAVLIWGAVIHVDPNLTPEGIANKLSMEEAMNNNVVCVAAIVESLPKKREPDAA